MFWRPSINQSIIRLVPFDNKEIYIEQQYHYIKEEDETILKICKSPEYCSYCVQYEENRIENRFLKGYTRFYFPILDKTSYYTYNMNLHLTNDVPDVLIMGTSKMVFEKILHFIVDERKDIFHPKNGYDLRYSVDATRSLYPSHMISIYGEACRMWGDKKMSKKIIQKAQNLVEEFKKSFEAPKPKEFERYFDIPKPNERLIL